MENQTYDVIIVGAGILGIAHAFHSLKAGLKVALFERNSYPQDASVRNFGQVVPSGFGTKWQRFGRTSLDIYKAIQAEIDITVRQEGSIYLANTEDELTLLDELAEINVYNDYPSVRLTKEKCLSRYSGFRSSYVKGGLYFPGEIIVDPRQAASKIIQYLASKFELAYFPRNLIREVSNSNGTVEVINSRSEKYFAQKVFICSGNEFQTLFPEVFADSGIQIVKLQMLETVPQPHLKIRGSVLTGRTIRRYESFQECPSYAAIKAKENVQAYHNKKGIHILLKQSPSGSMILGDSHEYTSVQTPEELSFDIDNEINCFMLGQTQQIFDLEDWRIKQSWLGYYCQHPHRDIFNHTINEHIHIVTAIGGKGMTGAFGYALENTHNILSLKLNAL